MSCPVLLTKIPISRHSLGGRSTRVSVDSLLVTSNPGTSARGQSDFPLDISHQLILPHISKIIVHEAGGLDLIFTVKVGSTEYLSELKISPNSNFARQALDKAKTVLVVE